ncbi:MAG: hypothetical protein ACK5MX_07555, partial [Pseudanabaena sp.]
QESHPKSPRIISVLNAFRHQRFDTKLHLNYSRVFNRAQRLSASEIRHNTKLLSLDREMSAQRLSASEIRHRPPQSQTRIA